MAATFHSQSQNIAFYMLVCEAIAFRVIGFYYLRSEENPADILSHVALFIFLEGRYHQDEGLSMGRKLGTWNHRVHEEL